MGSLSGYFAVVPDYLLFQIPALFDQLTDALLKIIYTFGQHGVLLNQLLDFFRFGSQLLRQVHLKAVVVQR